MEQKLSPKITLESSLKAMEIENFLDRYFYRPIAFRMALVLRHTPVTPNMVTILSIIVGVYGGTCFYSKDLTTNLLGVFFLIFANTLDCVDGQLARLTGIKSKIGRALDGFAGDLWFLSIYFSICLRLINEDWHISIFLVAFLSAFSHSRQAAMADYFKNLHLFFLKGAGGSEFDDYANLQKQYLQMSWSHNFWETLFMYFYRFYTKKQEKMSPTMHDLRMDAQSVYPHEIPASLTEKFRELAKYAIHWMHLLSFNGRTPVLFLAVVFDVPWVYFIFEIGVLNLGMFMGIKHYESICNTIRPFIEAAKK